VPVSPPVSTLTATLSSGTRAYGVNPDDTGNPDNRLDVVFMMNRTRHVGDSVSA
jgi:hypothetical protein